MDTQRSIQFVYKDSNVMRWTGLIFLIVSPLFFIFRLDTFPANDQLMATLENVAPWLFLAIGLIMIIFSSSLTVIADKSTRILHLRYGLCCFVEPKIFHLTKSPIFSRRQA